MLGRFLFLLGLTGMLLRLHSQTEPFRDPALTPEVRAADLVNRMTLPEKISQMQNGAPAIPRLSVPAYDWWNEGLHGVARAGLATVFPQAIGLAATWDTVLQNQIADVISTEARAKFNDFSRHDVRTRYHGLTFWSPNINIFRDPRWGRGQETYGEDPVLTASMAVAFIKGLQETDGHYLKAIATAKHFAVHSGPENLRHGFNVVPSEQDLEQTYLYAFHRTVTEGNVDSFMCAYNSVDGVPACANNMLLGKTLRQGWQFNGYVVSDCGAVTDILKGHRYAPTMSIAAADAVKAGTDLTCGNEFPTLAEAVQNGAITEAEINRAVTRLFTARMRLGLFDSPERVSYAKIGLDQLASPAHADMALKASEESIVLLKNEGNLLPLQNFKGSVAVVGPAADDPDAMLGNYNGIPRHIATPLSGLLAKFSQTGQVHFALGSTYAPGTAALVPQYALTVPGGGAHGLKAEYFANDHFAGAAALVRTEPRPYFYWDMQDPAVLKAIPSSTFSVRWTGSLRVDQSGTYQLGYTRQECDNCPGSNSIRLSLDKNAALVRQEGRANNSNETSTVSLHLEAGRDYALRLEYSQKGGGSGVELVWAPPTDALLAAARKTMQDSDVIIAVLGLNSRLEGEESKLHIAGFDGGDRTSLDLPAGQEELLGAALATGKPTIVVLVNGSALAVNIAKGRARAILECWYGGEAGGTAIANTLLGQNNPAGRLPVTFYKSADQLPPFTDYSMQNRTYRYFKGEPLFPFGYGLSYSQFSYSDLHTAVTNNHQLQFASEVTNSSARAGDEVVQFYAQPKNANPTLQGFKRIHLRPGQRYTATFTLPTDVHAERVSIGGGQPLSQWTGTHFKTAVIQTKLVALVH